MFAILAQREREEATYLSVVDKLKVIDRFRDVLELDREDLTDPPTICKAKDAITMAHARSVLQRTTTLFDRGDVEAIDGTTVDRVAASCRSIRRTDYQ